MRRSHLVALVGLIAVLALGGTTTGANANTSTTTGASTKAAAGSVPPCATDQLEVWLGIGEGGGTAGGVYYPMEFTNVGSATCYLYGFPGVSAWNGTQLGGAAAWDRSVTPRTLTLTPAATGHTVLKFVDLGVFPPDQCRPQTATDLRVFPPGSRSASFIPYTFPACGLPGPTFLTVQPVQQGLGVPGH